MKPGVVIRLFLTAALVAGLGGCASTGEALFSGPADAANNLIASFTVPPKFRQAVQREDWASAADLYAAHPDLLDREAPQEVTAANAAVNARWQPRLEGARRALEDAMAVEGFSLAALAAALSAAQGTLHEYEGQNLLVRHRSEEATTLKQGVAGVGDQLAKVLPDIFGSYDHANQPLLLRELPLPLDRATQEAAVLRGFEPLLQAVRDSTPGKAGELMRTYAPLVPADRRGELRSAYLTKVSMARFGVVPQRLKPSQRLELAADGLAYGNLRVLRLDTGRAAAPVLLDGHKVETVLSLGQLDGTLRQLAAAGDSLVVIIDASIATAVTEYKPGPAATQRVQVGTQSRPNEAYKHAQDEVQRLEDELREVELTNDDLQRQAQALGQQSGGRGSGALAAVLGSVLGTTSVITTRDNLDAARATLEATPRMSEQPIYREVVVQQLVRETHTLAQPIVYLADAESRQLHRASGSFAAVQRETVAVATASTDAQRAGSVGALPLRLADFHAGLDRSAPLRLSQLEAASRKDRAAHERKMVRLQRAASNRSKAAITEARARAQAIDVATAVRKPATRSAVPGSNTCQVDMSYLDSRLPRFRVPVLQNLREEAVRMNVLDVIRRAKAQGVSAHEAVDQMLQSARSMDSQVPIAGKCAAEVDALGTSDEAFVEGIRKGGAANIANCDGIRNSCLCAGLAARLGAYVTRAAAAAMQCHARAGNW